MIHTVLTLILLACSGCFTVPGFCQSYPKLSPFDELAWQSEDRIHVRLEDEWYRLQAIDGQPLEKILAFSQQTWPTRWQKRFVEDLVEVLSKMGHAPDDRVDLKLQSLDGQRSLERKDVLMTSDKRNRLRRSEPRAPSEGFARLSPFDGLRWQGNDVEVQVGSTWYQLHGIHGFKTEAILDYCRKTWPGIWQKRFVEDLVEVLAGMGNRPGERVDLDLRELPDGQRKVLAGVLMTHEKRQRLRAAHSDSQPRASGPVHRVERAHAARPDREWSQRLAPIPMPGRSMPRARAEEDLDQLEWWIENRFSYRDLRGLDYRQALDAIRRSLPNEVSLPSFADQLERLLALFGDGHARLSGPRGWPGGYAPFFVTEHEGELYAVRPDRSACLDPEFPILVSIDGLAIEEWIEVASRYVANGSPQLRRSRALRELRELPRLRMALGREAKSEIELVLRKWDPDQRRKLSVSLCEGKPIFGSWPRHRTERMDNGLAYLRIDRMRSDAAFLDEIDRFMTDARDTRGLIVDVRGNGGGSRAALRRLFPYLMADDEEPVVVNLGRYRLETGQDPNARDGYLANRYLYPATWPGWSPAKRQAIEELARQWKPSWKPAQADFSAMHYFVLSREDNPRAYSYGKPVMILLDVGCFSATDIFLGAFEARPNVTLMGHASSGGSGRSQSYRLAHSGFELRLSSMVSYRPNGELYDGVGIEPHVLVSGRVEDFLGQTDTFLEAAVKQLLYDG